MTQTAQAFGHEEEPEQELAPENIADGDVIREAIEEIGQFKAERNAINQKIGAVYADLESKGISRKALKLAITYFEMDESERDSLRVGFEHCQRAMAEQLDLFDSE